MEKVFDKHEILFCVISIIIYLLLSLLFINGHKKGVEIAFCSILLSGLGVPITTDKTIAPHRYSYITSQDD